MVAWGTPLQGRSVHRPRTPSRARPRHTSVRHYGIGLSEVAPATFRPRSRVPERNSPPLRAFRRPSKGSTLARLRALFARVGSFVQTASNSRSRATAAIESKRTWEWRQWSWQARYSGAASATLTPRVGPRTPGNPQARSSVLRGKGPSPPELTALNRAVATTASARSSLNLVAGPDRLRQVVLAAPEKRSSFGRISPSQHVGQARHVNAARRESDAALLRSAAKSNRLVEAQYNLGVTYLETVRPPSREPLQRADCALARKLGHRSGYSHVTRPLATKPGSYLRQAGLTPASRWSRDKAQFSDGRAHIASATSGPSDLLRRSAVLAQRSASQMGQV